MKLLVINGPNLNLLGLREPAHYGTENYTQLIEKIQAHCAEKQIEVTCYQSNHEGDLVDRVQQAYFEGMDGIVINPGAYTHTSIAILDAVKAVRIPTAEVHISNVKEREDFRQVSYIREACCFTVMGHGTDGYLEAIDYLARNI
ncbi:MAG: type II 3-dehydroquinate dehydratase [Clostridia bacterium]